MACIAHPGQLASKGTTRKPPVHAGRRIGSGRGSPTSRTVYQDDAPVGRQYGQLNGFAFASFGNRSSADATSRIERSPRRLRGRKRRCARNPPPASRIPAGWVSLDRIQANCYSSSVAIRGSVARLGQRSAFFPHINGSPPWRETPKRVRREVDLPLIPVASDGGAVRR